MARQFKARYTGLFPPLKGFIPKVVGTTTTLIEDIGQYTDIGQRLVAPSEPGIVVARNQYTGGTKSITISITDGVTVLDKTLKVALQEPKNAKGTWIIKNNIGTSAGNGIELTCAGGMASDPYDVYFVPIQPEKHKLFYYDQLTSFDWHLSPRLSGAIYGVEMGKAPIPVSVSYYTWNSRRCPKNNYSYYRGTGMYCYDLITLWAEIVVQVRAINLVTNEVLGEFCLSSIPNAPSNAMISSTTWDYNWVPQRH